MWACNIMWRHDLKTYDTLESSQPISCLLQLYGSKIINDLGDSSSLPPVFHLYLNNLFGFKQTNLSLSTYCSWCHSNNYVTYLTITC